MPNKPENEPSQPPVKTNAKALSLPDAAASNPGVSHEARPALKSQTSQRITSPTRHVISMRIPSSVLGSVQITPSSINNTPPKDQWPLGSTRPMGSLPQNA